VSPLAETIRREIEARPQQFAEVVDGHREVAWRELLKAWGELRTANILTRDDDGNYVIGKT
jgi:hypothetical protein